MIIPYIENHKKPLTIICNYNDKLKDIKIQTCKYWLIKP